MTHKYLYLGRLLCCRQLGKFPSLKREFTKSNRKVMPMIMVLIILSVAALQNSYYDGPHDIVYNTLKTMRDSSSKTVSMSICDRLRAR